MGAMRRGGDDTSTLQLGHYLDRVVFSRVGYSDGCEIPVGYFMVALGMAVYGTVEGRIGLIWEVAVMEEKRRGREKVGEDTAAKVVDWLGETCQLPADNRVMEVRERER